MLENKQANSHLIILFKCEQDGEAAEVIAADSLKSKTKLGQNKCIISAQRVRQLMTLGSRSSARGAEVTNPLH